MLVMQRPTVEVLESFDGSRKQFAIGPLEPGFGHTIGNSLRRALLSAIPEQPSPRFASTAPPRVRDHQWRGGGLTDIILNLKDLVLVVLCEEPVTLRLDVRGPADVTAADIQRHPDVEILSSEAPIATLNKTGGWRWTSPWAGAAATCPPRRTRS